MMILPLFITATAAVYYYNKNEEQRRRFYQYKAVEARKALR